MTAIIDGAGGPFASEEQLAIVDSVERGCNVCIVAAAGSGKTTTTLFVARRWAELHKPSNVLVLTYSKPLQSETVARFSSAGVRGVVKTIHAAMQGTYGVTCDTDHGLRKILECRMPIVPSASGGPYGVMVIDEAQDLTPLRYAVIKKFLRDVTAKQRFAPQLVLMGDPLQCVYAFDGADARFVTLAPELYRENPHKWERKVLTTSYRLSPETCDYVNHAMHPRSGGMPILPRPGRARSPHQRVWYVAGSNYEAASAIAKFIIGKIKRREMTCDDVMITSNSVVPGILHTPLQQLLNTLTCAGIPLCIEGRELELMRSKVLVSTFCGSKGMERNVVVCFCHDVSYFDMYAREADRALCPPVLHVAATRAKQKLILLAEQCEGGHLPFLDRNAVTAGTGDFVDVTELAEYRRKNAEEAPSAALPTFLASSFLRIEEYWARDLRNKLELVPVSAAADSVIRLPSSVDVVGADAVTLVESVKEVNALALPALLEMLSRESSMLGAVRYQSELSLQDESGGMARGGLAPDLMEGAKALVAKDPFAGLTRPLSIEAVSEAAPFVLELAALFRATPRYISPYQAHYAQLRNSGWGWLSVADAKAVLVRLNAEVHGHADAATAFKHLVDRQFGTKCVVKGQLDILTRDACFVLNCSDTGGGISDGAVLQLALFAWLLHAPDLRRDAKEGASLLAAPAPAGGGEGSDESLPLVTPSKFVLLNALTGERHHLVLNTQEHLASLDHVVSELVRLKLEKRPTLPDEQFLRAAQEVSKAGVTGAEVANAFRCFQASGAKSGGGSVAEGAEASQASPLRGAGAGSNLASPVAASRPVESTPLTGSASASRSDLKRPRDAS